MPGQAPPQWGTQQVLGTPGPAPRDRRRLRAAGVWALAVLVLAVTAAGTGYGLTRLDRTDLPGLATESDGRWDYPALELPALPSGSPPPFVAGNSAEEHHADLRDLVLPSPADAEPDKKLPADAEWVPTGTYLDAYDARDRGELRRALRHNAVRHIAATGWLMPDGTRTRIYLLRFNSGAFATAWFDEVISRGDSTGSDLAGAPEAVLDESWPVEAGPGAIETYVFDEPEPREEDHVRQAYLRAGDVIGLVVQSRADEVAPTPFRQTVILQSQLLG